MPCSMLLQSLAAITVWFWVRRNGQALEHASAELRGDTLLQAEAVSGDKITLQG